MWLFIIINSKLKLICPFQETEQTTYLSFEDIRAISSQKVSVPELNSDQLKEQILQSAKTSYSHEDINYITKEYAKEYASSIENDTGVLSFHADKCSINDKVVFERTDHRVSKEILNCKFYLNPARYEIIIEHNSTNLKERKRIRCYFNHVMGMAISDSSVVLDICQVPYFEIKNKVDTKTDDSKWESAMNWTSPSKPRSLSKHRIAIYSHQALNKDVISKLSSVQVLGCATKTSLQESYPDFVPFQREPPHERMPILKDPTLVRAAQLAVLEVAKDPRSREDVKFVVQMFKSIERSFRRLLVDRLQSSINHEE